MTDYPNGQIPISELMEVGGSYFRKDAGTAMVALRAAYQAALGRTLIINDGYRDLAGQQQAWNDYQNGGNLAAFPGTSNHGWGIAVDFGGEIYTSSTSQGHQWLQNNAPTYGWIWAGRNFSQIENWHWEYNGTYNPQNPNDTRKKDNDMRVIRWTSTGNVFTVGQEYIKYETNPGQANTMASILNGGGIIDVDNTGLNAVQLSLGIPWYGVDMALNGTGYSIEGQRVSSGGNVWSRALEIKNK